MGCFPKSRSGSSRNKNRIANHRRPPPPREPPREPPPLDRAGALRLVEPRLLDWRADEPLLPDPENALPEELRDGVLRLAVLAEGRAVLPAPAPPVRFPAPAA